MEFLAHQRAAYWAIRSEEFFEYWQYGALGTGKTTGLAAGFTQKLITDPGPYFVGNSTAGNAWAVQWPLIKAFAAKAGVKAKRGRDGELPAMWVGDSKCWVVGMKNAGSNDSWMGRNSKGGWYEEVNKYNQHGFDMLLGRGRLSRAIHLMGMNPEGPRALDCKIHSGCKDADGLDESDLFGG